jgi:uncharacterized membrane protein YkvA (DUF1232 family)
MENYEPRGFRKATREASKYASDPSRARKLIESVLNKAYRHQEQLRKVWDDLLSLCRMIRAWTRGEYQMLPRKTILMAIAAAVYFLNPFDMIPDFIPGVGYLDDATVIAFVLNSIRGDVMKFLEWERKSSFEEIKSQRPLSTH